MATQIEDAFLSECKQKLSTDGYCVVNDFADAETVEQLKSRAHKLVDEWEPEAKSVFTTTDQGANTDDYFMNSADKINMFFEDGVFDEDGSMKVEKGKSINKIGHALHEKDEVFHSFSSSDKVKALVGGVIGIKSAAVVQSMFIFKQPHIGGEVSPHIDSTFLLTEPPSCHAVWLALEDANQGNGCLWVLPGSHTQPIRRQFVRTGNGLEVKMETIGEQAEEWDTEKFVPVEVPAGTLVIMHGQLAHLSHPNKSTSSRNAYTLHVVDSKAEWNVRNWLQRPEENPFPLLQC